METSCNILHHHATAHSVARMFCCLASLHFSNVIAIPGESSWIQQQLAAADSTAQSHSLSSVSAAVSPAKKRRAEDEQTVSDMNYAEQQSTEHATADTSKRGRNEPSNDSSSTEQKSEQTGNGSDSDAVLPEAHGMEVLVSVSSTVAAWISRL